MKQLALILSLLLPAAALAQGKPDIVEVLEINGEINGATASHVAQFVEKANDNAKVKAVVLVLDTPGGSVTASSAIYEDLARLKAPVIVWCQSLCASGGVYAAMSPAVKWVAVRQETIGGSVGVIMQMMRFHRLLEWAKVDPKTYRSGHLKDAGNPLRAGEEAEEKYLQSIVASLADKFYGIVEKSRGAKIKDWEAIKTARIFIGPEIVKVGLADAVATKADVIAKAKELSGSKIIFTREELQKMSSAAHSDPSFHSPTPAPRLDHGFGDIPWIVETAKEIMGGQSVKFSYKLPYAF